MIKLITVKVAPSDLSVLPLSLGERVPEGRVRETGMAPPLSLFRAATTAMTVLISSLLLIRAAQADPYDWQLYQKRFYSPEGRIIDDGNQHTSHSEGQGIGMLLAVHYNDKKVFDQLWQWTQKNLARSSDHLFSWKWQPASGITDSNNATDGDLLIAWALYRAGEKWHEPRYLEASRAISKEIREKLIRSSTFGLLLIPGEKGFIKNNTIVINLSYWIFPALNELEKNDPAPDWKALQESGYRLLEIARFGRWQLNPNWVAIKDDQFSLETSFEPKFSYNAVRIPLYLIWAQSQKKSLLKPFLDFWHYFDGARFIPSWVSLVDDSVDSYSASAGINAIITLSKTFEKKKRFVKLPKLSDKDNYYSASLLLLSKMALQEISLK